MWTIVGAFLGYLLFGIPGALLGWLSVMLANRYREGSVGGGNASVAEQQKAFFNALFLLMGRLSKADGRVSEEEIQLASTVMQRMGLSSDAKRAAQALFNEGKSAEFDLAMMLSDFQAKVGSKSQLTVVLLETLLVAAYSDGNFSLEEKALMSRICAYLGIGVSEFERIHEQIRNQSRFRDQTGEGVGEQGLIAAAYEALGVRSDMTDAQIKKAYRRLMSANHPDKLTAKGLPDEMVKLAKERTQEIQAAYDTIRKSRKS